jgi:hypothetical protein
MELDMVRPTLLIGLGGTGQRVLAEVKRRMQGFDGTAPPEVRFLAIDTATTLVEGADTLDPQREFVALPSYLATFLQEVRGWREGPTPATAADHISSWLDYDYWLSSVPGSVLNLASGSPVSRPLARLALFSSMSRPYSSAIVSALRTAVLDVRSRGYQPSFQVALVASLAGGTGSGLFIDVAHLIKTMADLEGAIARTSAYLFLPELFLPLVSNPTLAQTGAATYAALRELSRFYDASSLKRGIPLYYTPPNETGTQLDKGCLKVPPFDSVYLFDRLDREHGEFQVDVATQLATTALLAGIDDEAGILSEQHIANREAVRVNTFGRGPAGTLSVGLIGSYTLELPVAQLVEIWARSLADDLLQAAVGPETAMFDAPGESQVEGAFAALATSLELWSRGDWHDLPSAEEISEIFIYPLKKQISRQLLTAVYNYSVIWNDYNEAKRGNSSSQSFGVSVGQSVEAFLTRHIGTPDANSGELTGGDLAGMWSSFIESKAADFQAQLREAVRASLDQPGPGGMRSILISLRTLQRQIAMREADYRQTRGALREKINALRDSLKQYSLSTPRPAFLPADKAIQEYLEKYQVVLDLEQQYIGLDWALRFLQLSGSNLDSAITELSACISVLVDSPQSVVNQLKREKGEMELGLTGRATSATMQFAWDGAWVDSVYATYMGQGAIVHDLLPSAHWDLTPAPAPLPGSPGATTPQGATGTIKLSITQNEDTQAFEVPLSGDPHASQGFADLLTFCRGPFKRAFEQESVLKYLKVVHGAGSSNGEINELGKLIHQGAQRGSPTLYEAGDADEAVFYYLVASPSGVADPQEREAEQQFLNQLQGAIAISANRREHELTLVRSSNRHALTLLAFRELVSLEHLSSNKPYRREYEHLDEQARKQLHVFPPEASAVCYEADLRKLLPPRVLNLLEDWPMFRLFAAYWAYGQFATQPRLVYWQAQVDKSGATDAGSEGARGQWRLGWTSLTDQPNRSRQEDYVLSSSSTRHALLEACEAFVLDKSAYSPDAGYPQALPPVDVLTRALEQAQQGDFNRRLTTGELDKSNPKLAPYRDYLDDDGLPPAVEAVARLLALDEALAGLDLLGSRFEARHGPDVELELALHDMLRAELRVQQQALKRSLRAVQPSS